MQLLILLMQLLILLMELLILFRELPVFFNDLFEELLTDVEARDHLKSLLFVLVILEKSSIVVVENTISIILFIVLVPLSSIHSSSLLTVAAGTWGYAITLDLPITTS